MGKDPSVRSALMSRIRGFDTKPELHLRRALWHSGLRYRLKSATPAGRPDLVFPGPKVAVFVDGCFWHGCPDHYVRPRSQEEFWADKLEANVLRDRRQTLLLEEEGWAVCRFWEHEVYEDIDQCAARVKSAVEGAPSRSVTRWHVRRVVPIDQAGKQERRDLETLRNPDIRRSVEQARSTAKWSAR
jgi:DNA mismatch endonuclease, patch repair protein